MKSSNSLVTVLMPVYNGEKYLAEAIESVLNQTFTDFELLIIDDCSKDNSVEIIHSFSDQRIRLIINKDNIGQTKTLNKGIDASTSKFIARIDQDDLYNKKKLEKQIGYINKYKCDIIGTWSYGIDEYNRKIYKIIHPTNDYDIKQSMIIRQPFTHSSLLMKKSSLIEVNKYPKNIHVAMDYGLLVNLAIHGCTFSNIPDYLTSIRYHNKSSSFYNKYQLACETLSIQKKTASITDNKNLSTYKAIQFYRLFQILKFLPKNFSKVIQVITEEIRLSNIYYFILIVFKLMVFKKYILHPSKMIKIN